MPPGREENLWSAVCWYALLCASPQILLSTQPCLFPPSHVHRSIKPSTPVRSISEWFCWTHKFVRINTCHVVMDTSQIGGLHQDAKNWPWDYTLRPTWLPLKGRKGKRKGENLLLLSVDKISSLLLCIQCIVTREVLRYVTWCQCSTVQSEYWANWTRFLPPQLRVKQQPVYWVINVCTSTVCVFQQHPLSTASIPQPLFWDWLLAWEFPE